MVRASKNAAGADTEPITIRLPRRLARAIRRAEKLPPHSVIRQRMEAEEYPRNKGGVTRWLMSDELCAMLELETRDVL